MAIGETNHQVIFLSVGWSVFGMALLLSGARIHGRFVMTRHPAAGDDLNVMLLTLLTSTAMMIAATFLTSFLLGRHSWNITQDDRQRASHAYYASAACFMLTIAITKVAILLQLAKIFRPFTKRAFYWVCWGLVGFVVLWTLGTILGNLLICTTPGANFWRPREVARQCSITSWTVQGVISIVMDCILMMLPLPVIWQLHIPFKQKSLAFAQLAVGSVGCFFSIVRTASLHTLNSSEDATYDLFRIPLWFMLEALVAVCCGTLMGSKQLILHWFPSLGLKPDDILPPLQLKTTPCDGKNSRNWINLDDEDINKLRLESIMYRLAVIGSPWAQIPASSTDSTCAAEQVVNTNNTTHRYGRSRLSYLTPARPMPVRKIQGRKRHDSIFTQWIE